MIRDHNLGERFIPPQHSVATAPTHEDKTHAKQRGDALLSRNDRESAQTATNNASRCSGGTGRLSASIAST